jgi:hypothetical protein
LHAGQASVASSGASGGPDRTCSNPRERGGIFGRDFGSRRAPFAATAGNPAVLTAPSAVSSSGVHESAAQVVRPFEQERPVLEAVSAGALDAEC